MAGMKEIRGKIKSVQSTRKITKAMEMVAASKMRRAQERMRASRPYADKVREIIAHMHQANPEYQHPFSVPHPEAKTIGLILVTTDKGLCGGLNTNILRMVLATIKEYETKGIRTEATAIGSKGLGFLQRLGAKLSSHVEQLGDTPHLDILIGAVKVQLDAYLEGRLQAVYLGYTRFINTMKQEAVLERLLPLGTATSATDDSKTSSIPAHNWDYVYEPDAQSVIDTVIKRYIEARVYQAVAENMASEQASRMVAMKSASDNAETVIDDLKLVYNKSRQAAITKELSEIVGGAAA
ncbi:hypothetical protein BGZ81_000832, partial [Podila clonocystis]